MRKPRIELLTPDLDLSLTFIPDYNLLSNRSVPICAIALALWELSGSDSAERSSRWRDSQIGDSLEGSAR